MQNFLRQGAASLQHPKFIHLYTFRPKKGLKFGIFSSPIIEFSYARGRCPGPLSLALPLDPNRGFLRFALDVSPSKQFLKVGSPAIGHSVLLL